MSKCLKFLLLLFAIDWNANNNNIWDVLVSIALIKALTLYKAGRDRRTCTRRKPTFPTWWPQVISGANARIERGPQWCEDRTLTTEPAGQCLTDDVHKIKNANVSIIQMIKNYLGKCVFCKRSVKHLNQNLWEVKTSHRHLRGYEIMWYNQVYLCVCPAWPFI